MTKIGRIGLAIFSALLLASGANAQVASVTYGKNRVQYKKFKWQYYQSENFNVYFNEGGQELAKYVAIAAEKELPQIEEFTEHSLQRRANIILYNHFTDYKQTNIGLETGNINPDEVTKLVNNKLVVYFDADHYNLRRQIRQGIADVIVGNIMQGEGLGEMASNQNLLDMPKWLVDGYIRYTGENWSTALDDDLRSEILSGNYSKFKKLAFNRPQLAGHAFWYFIEENYKKENVTYFFHLLRSKKNMDAAALQVTGKKFKALMAQFMEYNDDKYSQDVRRRKNYPKGSAIESFDINKRKNYYHFNVNPNKRNNWYVVTRFKKGLVSVILSDGYDNKTLLKYGVRMYEKEMNPNYPMMAWDPKGTRLAVVFAEKGRLKLFTYDTEKDFRPDKLDLTGQFDQIQDVQYMNDHRTLLFSAVKNGHTDIYIYNLNNQKATAVTNDVYDDRDPSFVSFPGKTGIIFSSNRPGPEAAKGDTILPSDYRYNVFLINDFGSKAELNQITQLSNLKYGNARYPTQYNVNHFTFVSDENGIANRYAGFFTTVKEGYDTLVVIGDDILRNPSLSLIDSTLRANNKTETDTVAIVSISSDSAFVFPLSNYPSNLAESRIAGDKDQVSEVTRQSDEKILYKLKIDENTLRKRNISTPPTAFGKKMMRESELTNVSAANVQSPAVEITQPTIDTLKKVENVFQSEFDQTPKKDSAAILQNNSEIVVSLPVNTTSENENATILRSLKLFRYKPVKFSADFGAAGVSGSPIANRYQQFLGGSGPIMLSSGTPLNGMVQLGIGDVMEDYKINGAFRIGTNLKDNEWFANFQNLRRRVDWGLSYYRNVVTMGYTDPNDNLDKPLKLFTNQYQGNITYPFDEVRSLRLTLGVRSDRFAFTAVDGLSSIYEDYHPFYALSKLEYVHDNSLQMATNIMNGLRYKVYGEWNREISKGQTMWKPNMFNLGLDARYYHPIYRNFIWAGRVAADFSLGNQKICYYLGGVDGWLMFGPNVVEKNGVIKERYFIESNKPAPDGDYAFQSLAVNMRGYKQNIANGNNAVVINSELRLPILSTFFDKVVSNAFLNNFMITQFIDLGTAWNGNYNSIKRPSMSFTNYDAQGNPGNVTVRVKAGGIGPFAGGYGFGARSNLLGYYVRYDVGWPMSGFFKGKPMMYLALGLDF